MSDTGNFEFEQTPQQTSDQPPQGWYFAQGDPPGTERYWNGSAWEGAYRAVGGFTPTEVVVPVVFPAWAKVVAWVLTVLKAMPLVGLAILVALWESITREIENESDFQIREFSVIVLVIGLMVVLFGAVLLLGQLISVMKEQRGRAAIWSGILAAIDVLFVAASYVDGGLVGASFILAITVMQVGLFAMMLKLWNDQKASSAAD